MVTETIRWRFPEGEERHGILRNVKVRTGYQDSETQYRYYELSGVTVTSPSGAPTDIAISDFGAFRQIRVGSPSETISGTADYVVRYRLEHIVNDIGDGTAEFYYNVVDPSNGFPQLDVSATVTGPAPATRAACFYGELGSQTPCEATAGPTSTFAVPDLEAEQGASVLTSYPRAAFGDLTPDLREGDPEADSGSVLSPASARVLGWVAIGLGILLPLLAGALMGLLVWTRGRDEQYAGLTPGLTPGLGQQVPVVVGGPEPTVAVQFTPPSGVQPGMVGTIVDEEVNLVDVTATLVDLAVRGHLQIARDDQGVFRADDWVLTRTAPPADAVALAPYEQVLLDSVFAAGGRVALSQLKNRFKPTLDAVQRLMYEEVVQRGWFRRSPQRQRAGWVGLGTLLAVGSVMLFFFAGGGVSAVFGDAGLVVPPTFVLFGGLGGHRTHHPVDGQADGRPHRAGVGSARPVTRVRAIHRDGGGEPDPVGGGAAGLQPLPALRHRLRPRRPLGPGLRGGRRGRDRRRPRRRVTDLVRRQLVLGRVLRRRVEHGLVLHRRGRHVRLDAGLLGVQRLQRRGRVQRRWWWRLVRRQLVTRHPRCGRAAGTRRGPRPAAAARGPRGFGISS